LTAVNNTNKAHEETMKAKGVPKKKNGFIAEFLIRVISSGISRGLCEDRNNQIRWHKKKIEMQEQRKAREAKENEATEKENKQ